MSQATAATFPPGFRTPLGHIPPSVRPLSESKGPHVRPSPDGSPRHRRPPPQDPVLSPDGRWAAYTVAPLSRAPASPGSPLHVAATDAVTSPGWITEEAVPGRRPRWSPDSAHLFFLSEPLEEDAPLLCRAHRDGSGTTCWRSPPAPTAAWPSATCGSRPPSGPPRSPRAWTAARSSSCRPTRGHPWPCSPTGSTRRSTASTPAPSASSHCAVPPGCWSP